jgi:molybdopterin molybdotransferase
MPKKLLDDCFLHDGDRLRHDQAIALLRSRLAPVTGTERVALADVAGRVLAEPAMALRPVPAHTNSAVDGYGFAAADYAANAGHTFPVGARVAAGHPLDSPVAPGSAVRIFTGAMLPPGIDTVAMQEDCEAGTGDDGKVTVQIPAGLKRGANVRQAGEDVAAGTRLFEAGALLRPQDAAALASIGIGEVVCRRRLAVAIVSTGDEVIRAGSRPLGPGEVYDANAPMLAGLVRAAGADVTDLGVWPDDAGEIRRRLADAAQRFDVILTSGGASRGEEDHMVEALGVLGKLHLWQLAIKPGRPLSFGQIGDAIMVGLPGNPVAVFVCFLMYAYPMLRRLGGTEWPEPRRLVLPAAFTVPKRKTGRREFFRGMLIETEAGLAVDKYARDGSGLITGLRLADGLIDIGEDVTAIAEGDRVSFIPFSEFGILSA